MFGFQNKSVHFPLRSKYNRLTKVARFLQENPSCLLCNILHHYLHQANYSIIDDATMVSVQGSCYSVEIVLDGHIEKWLEIQVSECHFALTDSLYIEAVDMDKISQLDRFNEKLSKMKF